MFNLRLDNNEHAALTSALNNYLEGHGMDATDEDEDTLENLVRVLEGRE